MAQKKSKRASGEAGFDLTPMIDCVFLLLIFFMLVSEMVKIEYEVLTLPRALMAIKDENPPKDREIINITYTPPITPDGRVASHIIIRREKMDNSEKLIGYLKGKATKAGMEGPASKLQVKIRADGRAEYIKVQQAMVACMKAGISRVSFGSEPKPPGRAYFDGPVMGN